MEGRLRAAGGYRVILRGEEGRNERWEAERC